MFIFSKNTFSKKVTYYYLYHYSKVFHFLQVYYKKLVAVLCKAEVPIHRAQTGLSRSSTDQCPSKRTCSPLIRYRSVQCCSLKHHYIQAESAGRGSVFRASMRGGRVVRTRWSNGRAGEQGLSNQVRTSFCAEGQVTNGEREGCPRSDKG